MTQPLSLTVLISGRGTNLQALLDAIGDGRLAARVVAVISDRPEAPGLDRARAAGVDTITIERTRYPDRAAFERDLTLTLDTLNTDLIVMAGFMRVLGDSLVERFPGRMINIHPSLLPRHRGLNTHLRVLEVGDPHHGASVHFVTPELDSGPVLSCVRIPVITGDTPESLARRLLPMEHELLVATTALFCNHSVQLRHEEIVLDNTPLAQPLVLGHDLSVPGRAAHTGSGRNSA